MSTLSLQKDRKWLKVEILEIQAPIHLTEETLCLLHVVDEVLGKVTPETARGAPEVAPEVLLLPVAVVGAARPLEDGVAPLALEV